MISYVRKAVLLGFLAPVSLMAELTINVYENASSVVFQANGSLDFSGLSYTIWTSSGGVGPAIEAADGTLAMTATTTGSTAFYEYASTTSPLNFGTGGPFLADDYTANGSLGFVLEDDGIMVRPAFVNGDSFSQRMEFTSATLESLGLAIGTYTWGWSNGETVTLNIPGAIPEPATYATLAGLAVLGLVVLRRRLRPRA